MTVSIKVLFFASAREAAGVSEVDINLNGDDDSPPTTASFRQFMANKYPKLAEFILDEESLTLALNEEYVPAGQTMSLNDGDTIALIPPISGG